MGRLLRAAPPFCRGPCAQRRGRRAAGLVGPRPRGGPHCVRRACPDQLRHTALSGGRRGRQHARCAHTRVLHHGTTGSGCCDRCHDGGVCPWRWRPWRGDLHGAAGRHAVADRSGPPRRRRGLDLARLAQSRSRARRRIALRRPGSAEGRLASSAARRNPTLHPCRRREPDTDPPQRRRDISPSWWRSVWAPWRAPHSPGAPGTNAGWAVGSAAIRFCDRHCRRGREDAATLLQRFARVPALRSFEAANCYLGLSLEGRPVRPKVRAICVSPAGVTFCFTEAQADEPPQGFDQAEGGTAWHVGHGALEGLDPCFPFLPMVLPIGDDESRNVARPARGGGRPASPRRGGSRPVACRTRRRRIVGLVGDRLDHRGSR